jgi:hypothetical protein
MYMVGPEGQQAPLCLDCYIRWQNVMLQQQEMHEREMNYLTDEMESLVGMHGILPRYPERRRIIQTGGVILNNIHVSNSEIGVLNTGTIHSMDATVTIMKTEGNQLLANVLATLSEAVIKSGELSNNQKNQILELLTSLSEEAVTPKEKRKNAVAKALLSELSSIIGSISTLTEMWDKAKTIFQQIFA